jgi:hypothetical protein
VKRLLVITALFLAALSTTSLPHVTNGTLSWNKEISRVFYARCAECHRDGGSAFSLMNFREVQPRQNEIQSAVLNRRMPPWGAVKGFGDFRNDQGLTQEEIELIGDWIESGARRGNNPEMLPPVPKFSKPTAFTKPKAAVSVKDDFTLKSAFYLDGLFPQSVPSGASLRVTATFPDGHVEPLLWLYQYQDAFRHPFLYRTPIDLPAGTTIQGLPQGAEVLLLPGKRPAAKSK